MKKLIAGLDLGTSKIKIAVARIRPDGYIDLLGVNAAQAAGVSRGNVTDLAEASGVLESLMSKVKQDYQAEIYKVILSTGGLGFSTDRASASIVLQGNPRELTQHDVEKVIQTTRNMNFSLDNFILHEITEDYILDGQEGVKKPVGLFAKKLELKLHTLFHNIAHVQNAISCVNYAGYDVAKVVFSGFVAVDSIATEEEKRNGIAYIDIGCETTKIVVVAEDNIKFCSLIGIGGEDITLAISSKFKIPIAAAEKLKLDSSITPDSASDRKVGMVIGGRYNEIPKSELNGIVREKADEIINKVKQELQYSSAINYIKSGIIMSGGGALLDGLLERIEESFGFPAKIGVVRTLPLNTEQPQHLFASVIGALEYYAKEMGEKDKNFNSRNPLSKLTHKLTNFINDYF